MVGSEFKSDAPAGSSPGELILEMRRVTKRFPGVVALDKVSIHLHKGEVLALMGENGAGKSTLMNVLSGAQSPDEGSIIIDGVPVQIRNIQVAKALGIAFVHQELMLSPNLDVAGNIFLGNEVRSPFLRVLNRSQMYSKAEALLSRVGLSVSPTVLVGKLTTAQQQMVEICKALNEGARILIMDEPTSSLAAHETETLLNIICDLKASSVSVIFISHRISEVLDIADRITVLRDGRDVGSMPREAAGGSKIVSMMIGRDLKNWFPQRRSQAGPVTLSVDSLVVPGAPYPITFHACRGEILGFAGLVGSGRTELMEVLAGIRPAVSGTVRFEQKAIRSNNPKDAIESGICLVPEDRKLHGLVLSMSITENIALPGLRYRNPSWVVRRKQQIQVAEDSIRNLQIRPPINSAKVVNLSGGNQQKVVLGKWLALHPKLLILDEPTRGIDVGARAEIYERIVSLAQSGLTILLVSSDMEEILGLSDRIVVLRERQIAGVVPRSQATKQLIGSLMTGGAAA